MQLFEEPDLHVWISTMFEGLSPVLEIDGRFYETVKF